MTRLDAVDAMVQDLTPFRELSGNFAGNISIYTCSLPAYGHPEASGSAVVRKRWHGPDPRAESE
jgi:hypothetical protein